MPVTQISLKTSQHGPDNPQQQPARREYQLTLIFGTNQRVLEDGIQLRLKDPAYAQGLRFRRENETVAQTPTAQRRD